MPVNSEIFRIYMHLFYGSPLRRRSRWVKLFGVLPFLWIRERGACDTRIYLFGKIPLFYINN